MPSHQNTMEMKVKLTCYLHRLLMLRWCKINMQIKKFGKANWRKFDCFADHNLHHPTSSIISNMLLKTIIWKWREFCQLDKKYHKSLEPRALHAHHKGVILVSLLFLISPPPKVHNLLHTQSEYGGVHTRSRSIKQLKKRSKQNTIKKRTIL